MKKKTILFRVLAIFLSLSCSFFLSEIILRLINWDPVKIHSGYLQFGYSTGIPLWDEDGILEEGNPVRIRLFKSDKSLFWKPIPNTQFTNSYGFRGKKEYSIIKSKNTLRILILGDSSSFLGKKLYSDFLEELLITNHPETKFEVINASVPGYTTFQGNLLLKQLLSYNPDYVCIYFGWNDHWIVPSGFTDQFQFSLGRDSYCFNLIRLMIFKIGGKKYYRVPINDFRKNIISMVSKILKTNKVPILITAPSGFEENAMPLWSFKFFKTFYKMDVEQIKDIPKLHEKYASMLREISKNENIILVDAINKFKNTNKPLSQYFRNDLIHLTEKGHKLIATEIYNEITKNNKLFN